MIKAMMQKVKAKNPLIHNITNYVTVNDCANVLLACGASPIMADDENEVQEITALCGGLTINMGTLNSRVVKSMQIAGVMSNKMAHPVVLDPVGVGASKFRTERAQEFLRQIKFSVIRGNISEIKSLAKGTQTTTGVDANIADEVTEENIEDVVEFAQQFAQKTQAIIVITGKIDIICGMETVYIVRNGNAMMSKVSGTGCMLTTMITAYVTANPDNRLLATTAAVALMGLAGERAFDRLAANQGNTSYRDLIMDEIYTMTGETLEAGAKYEMFK